MCVFYAYKEADDMNNNLTFKAFPYLFDVRQSFQIILNNYQ